MRRLLICVASLLVAGLGGMLFLALALLAEGTSSLQAQTGMALLALLAFAAVALDGGGPGAGIGIGLTLVWGTVLAVCFAPVAATALIGEAARTRSIAWYAGAAGVLAAAVPTLARAVRDLPADLAPRVHSVESRLTLLLFLVGTVAGFIYWAGAGRTSGAIGTNA